MEKNEEIVQGEKLSHCLDQLNEGNCPVISDQEIEELIETAAVVQQTYSKQEVPRLVIDEMVTTLATELSRNKRKRRGQWLYGGLACAVATLLLVIGTQFLVPKSLEKNISQEMDGNYKTEKIVAVVEQSVIPAPQVIKTIIEEPAKTIANEKIQSPTISPETTERVADSISKTVVDLIQVAQVVPEGEQTGQVAIASQEVPQEKVMAQNFAMTRMRMDSPMSLQENNLAKTENFILVQPNKVAKSITIDRSTATIRQVYTEGAEGSSNNIIITQRTIVDREALGSDKQGGNRKEFSSSEAGSKIISQQEKSQGNSLTVKLEKYWITVEGNKTTAELQKIVDSLIPKKMEE